MSDKLTLGESLIEIQARLKAPKSDFNDFGKYSYRSAEDILEAVKPLLKEYGVMQTISDSIELIGDRYYVCATVTVYMGTNNMSTKAYAREAEDKEGMDEAQITGSASSYARKYALSGMYAIDDTKDPDGQAGDALNDKKLPAPKKTTKAKSGLATEKQRALITEKLGEIGFTTPDEIKHYLATEYGINGLLSSTDASMVIEDLLNSSGGDPSYDEN